MLQHQYGHNRCYRRYVLASDPVATRRGQVAPRSVAIASEALAIVGPLLSTIEQHFLGILGDDVGKVLEVVLERPHTVVSMLGEKQRLFVSTTIPVESTIVEVPFKENGTTGTLGWVVGNGLLAGRTVGESVSLTRVHESIGESRVLDMLREDYSGG
jgi:hypothetical protein